jgi:hypothetical protein
MAAFTDQFLRRDPRSADPPLPFIFDMAAFEVHMQASELVEGLSLPQLSAICAELSCLFDYRLKVGLPELGAWAMFESTLLPDFGAGVSESVICGAFALWMLTDVRDLLDPLTRDGRPVAFPEDLPPETMCEAATLLMAGVRACFKGHRLRRAEEQRSIVSQRARASVLTRHQNTTEAHKRLAIEQAAKWYAEGKYTKVSHAAQHLANDIEKRPGVFYSKETIEGWLRDGGWTKVGWPNRPPTP